MGKEGLTPKQEQFCQKYMETGNASQAYRSIYACKNPKTINEEACRLLKAPKISARIARLQAESSRQSAITRERILEELSCILDACITDYLDFDGHTINFKSFGKLSERQVKAVESIKEGKHGIELKLHGKSWAIERICKMLGYDTPQPTDYEDEGLQDRQAFLSYNATEEDLPPLEEGKEAGNE